MAIPLYVLFGAILVWSLYRLLQVGRRHKDYPPGPPTIPILGNIHQVHDAGLVPKNRSTDL